MVIPSPRNRYPGNVIQSRSEKLRFLFEIGQSRPVPNPVKSKTIYVEILMDGVHSVLATCFALKLLQNQLKID